MRARHHLTTFAQVTLLLFAAGCGRHADRVLAPGSEATRASDTPALLLQTDDNRTAAVECPDPGYAGPIFTVQAPRLRTTYPSGGYLLSEDRIVSYEVPANRSVTIHWSADASGGCTDVHWYRWTLDIEDVFDETPRIDEATDLSHWSQRSDERSARVGPFSFPGTHVFYVDAADLLGYRSLAIVRIHVTAAMGEKPVPGEIDGE